MNEYKTRVYKQGPWWYVSYWLPYSGHLLTRAYTWSGAMRKAWLVEQQRPWS